MLQEALKKSLLCRRWTQREATRTSCPPVQVCTVRSWAATLGARFQGWSESRLGVRPAEQHRQAAARQGGSTVVLRVIRLELNLPVDKRTCCSCVYQIRTPLFSTVGGDWAAGAASGCAAGVSCVDRLSLMVGKQYSVCAYLAGPGHGSNLLMETITAYYSEMPAAAAVLLLNWITSPIAQFLVFCEDGCYGRQFGEGSLRKCGSVGQRQWILHLQ